MKNVLTRALSGVLALILTLSAIPATATADTMAAQQTDTAVYDFALQNSDLLDPANSGFVKAPFSSNAVKNALNSYYNGDLLNWRFAANNYALLKTDTNTVSDASYFGGAYGNAIWSGLSLGVKVNSSYPAGYWAAMTIRSDVAGNHMLTLDYQTRADGTAAGEVYLIKGALSDAEEIEAAMTKDALLGTVNFKSRVWTMADSQANLRVVSMEQGEYTLVFKGTQATAAGGYMYINKLKMTVYTGEPEDTQPEETTVPTTTAPAPTVPDVYDPADPDDGLRYNFAINGTALTKQNGTPFDGCLITGSGEQTAISAYYTAGTLHWKYAYDNFALLKTSTNTVTSVSYYGGGYDWTVWSGLRLGVKVDKGYPAGHWTAFTIQSPGKGNYDLTLNYQERADGTASGEIYLLKGTFSNATAVQAAMNQDTLLKKVSFKSKSWNMSDASASLGTVDLEKGEYTVVFKAAEATEAGGYIYINEMLAVKHQDKQTIQVGKLDYDFALQHTNLTYGDNKRFDGTVLDSANVANAITGYYDADKIRWKYTDNNFASLKTATNTVTSVNYYGGGYDWAIWSGLRLGVKVDKGYPAGYWVAFTILSPGKGNYQMTLDYQTRADGTAAGEVYLLKGTYKNSKAIEAAMTKNTLLQTVNFKSGSWTMEDSQMELGIKALEKGEYTIVFKAVEATEAGSYIYLNKLHMLREDLIPPPPPPPQLDTGIYNFVLEDTDLTYGGNKKFNAANFTSQSVQDAINKYYKNRKLNWKYHSYGLGKKGTGISALFGGMYNGKDQGWDGLKIYGKGQTVPMWQAFTIQSPGTGTYYPALKYMCNSAGASKGKIYFLPGDTKNIEKAIASNKAIAEISYDNRTGGNAEPASKVFYDAPLKLTAGKEYIVVFTAEEPGVNTGDYKLAYMYLRQFILYSEKTLPDPGPNIVTYDFDLTDKTNGIYTQGGLNLAEVSQDIADRYAKGELTWKHEATAPTMPYDLRMLNYAGMTAYSYEGDWMAFRCKAPGEGVYTLTMNYAISGNGALGAVYILPGSTTDVAFAMDHHNRIGKVDFYNETGDTDVKDGNTITLGTWEFGNEEEFIIVFEAYDNSPYSGFAYMWVSQVIATEGNHAKEETAQRKINSILIDAEPVKDYETTEYSAATEVNGKDYMFVPVKGGRMIVYNLDDMVKEETVRIPFALARGITVDQDGMVWVVGDRPVLFRYDPYTGESTITRNFGVDIPKAYGGYTPVVDEEGNLYFGTYAKAAVVKYAPATDTFTNIGQFNDDCYYAGGASILDNYLYIGIIGNTNGDEKRTAEMLKIDLNTHKCVGRTDIDALVGKDEDQIRASRAVGNTLFVGCNGNKHMIAIDINTMKLKTYKGFEDKPICYCITEETNGKVYFAYYATSIQGLCEYDIATDTLTDMDVKTTIFPLRADANSFVTIENNSLYPGVSMITHRKDAVIIYNPQTKRTNYVTEMTDEEADGSGLDILAIANGMPGTNEIYLGAFNINDCTAISLETGKVTHTFETEASQTNAILWYKGAMYTGNYNRGAITRVNTENDDRNVILLSMNNDIYEQNRIHTLAAGDDMLFAGTMPRSNTYDGCLVMIDLNTLEYTVERNIVDGCSVTGLAYADGLVFGTTSYNGGTGTHGPKNATVSSKIFVYDAANKKKIAELDPRDYFDGLPDQVPYIDAIAVDPDYANNGRIWAMVSETLFCFTFNRNTGKFNVKTVLSYDLTNFPSSNSRYATAATIAFKNGYLYVPMGNIGGFHKVNLKNFSDHARLSCETPRVFTIAEDGNIYYGIGTAELKMYPLDVTEADWKTAEALDAQIKTITGGTLANEAAIRAVRAAYDKLSLKHKALVQQYDELVILETDLLEAKIETIGEVTKDSQELIEGLLSQYQAMTEKDRKYVKNYSKLLEASKALQKIIDKEKADEVQALINGIKDLGEITLDDETAIQAIRSAYNALTFDQKKLVDAKLLLEAEAIITALRQERLKYLNTLIASFGEITLEDEPAIEEARAIFDWLNVVERERVDYETLNNAEFELKKLQKAAAAEVDALIEAIGNTVDRNSGEVIRKAREAYDALTPGSKKYVKLLPLLEEAEALFAEMEQLPVIIIIVAAVVVVAAGAVAAFFLIRKKKAKKDAVN